MFPSDIPTRKTEAQCGLSPEQRFTFYDHVHTTGAFLVQGSTHKLRIDGFNHPQNNHYEKKLKKMKDFRGLFCGFSGLSDNPRGCGVFKNE